jgi:hypothetical protein
MVRSAANSLSGAAGIGTGAGYGGGATAGGGDIVFRLGSGGSGLDSVFWAWLKNGIRAQGGDPNIITRKVVFR